MIPEGKCFPPNSHLSQWIAAQFPQGYRGWAVDVGASDGISINTTFVLEKSFLWSVLSVEANPDFEKTLKLARMWVEMCACASEPQDEAVFHIHEQNPESYSALLPIPGEAMSGGDWSKTDLRKMSWKEAKVRVKTVGQLLEKWEFPRLDALTVDVEGGELDVLKGCDLKKWKPKVVITECWHHVSPIDTYLEALGYKKTARNVHNDLFVLEAS